MENIIVGANTFKPYSAPQGARDPAVWVLEKPNTPSMYWPVITHSAALNASKTNVNVTVLVEVPVVTLADGSYDAKNKFVARMTYSALRNVVATESAVLALDALSAAIAAQKASILKGATK